MVKEQRVEAQLLSQEAERRVSDQLDKVEKINLDVQTDLLKIVQGQADGISFAGEGLVMKGIRVQEIKLQTDSVGINPFSALFGQIELNQPVNASARIVLTEVDINRALTSDYLRSLMQNFDFNVRGEMVSLQLQEIQIHLPGGGKMEFTGKVFLQEKGITRPLGFTARVRPRTQPQPIMIESFNCTQGEDISVDVIVGLMHKVKELVNLPHFEFDDMALRIKNLEVQQGKLILLADAQVRQIPST
ncbi:MAG: DUF2993 domain-containing protein [Stigonema ocellatum SAG 48.90 = DSM 106950]|nr:DUF2993 domain-containing protein [Stigonema ocellatum SAG 48.90 = DSM 106950]